jgi:hypothetical protein
MAKGVYVELEGDANDSRPWQTYNLAREMENGLSSR